MLTISGFQDIYIPQLFPEVNIKLDFYVRKYLLNKPLKHKMGLEVLRHDFCDITSQKDSINLSTWLLTPRTNLSRLVGGTIWIGHLSCWTHCFRRTQQSWQCGSVVSRTTYVYKIEDLFRRILEDLQGRGIPGDLHTRSSSTIQHSRDKFLKWLDYAAFCKQIQRSRGSSGKLPYSSCASERSRFITQAGARAEGTIILYFSPVFQEKNATGFSVTGPRRVTNTQPSSGGILQLEKWLDPAFFFCWTRRCTRSHQGLSDTQRRNSN